MILLIIVDEEAAEAKSSQTQCRLTVQDVRLNRFNTVRPWVLKDWGNGGQDAAQLASLLLLFHHTRFIIIIIVDSLQVT